MAYLTSSERAQNKVRVFTRIIISLSFISCSSIALSQVCTPNVRQAPSCPQSGSRLLDDSYPVGMASVSTTQGMEFAENFITKVMFAQNQPISVVVSATEKEFSILKESIKNNENLTEFQKKVAIQNLRRINPSAGDGENWQQDFYETQFNPKTGLPTLREVGNYLEIQKMRNGYSQSIVGALNSCGLNSGPKLTVKFDPKYLADGMSGGNIEALPNGICLIGRDHFETNRHFQIYAREACGSDKYIETPSDFLTVGHTDEFMNVIADPTKQSPCDYAITLASPQKAIELLAKNPDDPLFNKAMLYSMNKTSDPTGSIRKLCTQILKKKFLNQWDRELKINGGSDSGTAMNLIFSLLSPQALAQDSELDPEIKNDPDTILEKARALVREVNKHPITSCAALTNKDLLDYYTQPDFNERLEKIPSKLKLANENIQIKMNAFKKQLLERTHSHKPSCSPEIVDVPFLFDGKYDAKEKSVSGALSLFPNSTNGLRLGNTYIFSNPGNDTFGQYTADQYKKRGMKIDTIDTFWAHSQEGNLHCSSHLIRYCNPR